MDSTENRGSIIPFASGGAVTMNSGNISRISAIIGFGVNASVSEEGNLMINNFHTEFGAPRSGTLTSISCFFTANSSQNLGTAVVSVSAELYEESGGSFVRTFNQVTLSPSFTGLISNGSLATGTISGLSYPITAGRRYVFVCYVSTSGFTPVSLTGYVSGGININ